MIFVAGIRWHYIGKRALYNNAYDYAYARSYGGHLILVFTH